MSRESKGVYEFGPFVLDSAEQVLLRDGRTVPLKRKVFDLLLLLVENSGHLLSRDLIMSALWPDSFVEEGNLTVRMFELRKALGDKTSASHFIETLPRRGYRFIACVRQRSAQTTVTENNRSNMPTGEAGVEARSIAVLPFRQIGATVADEYLGLGMADALITRLANIKQITVRPTSAVRKYADESLDPAAAGRELRVQFVLDGSIRCRGKQIRVNVQLANLQNGALLWAKKFDEQFTSVFSVEDSISEQVAEALMVRVNDEERKLLAKRYTENTQAYQTYLKGIYFWNKRTPDGFKKGIQYFEQAIAVDPDYALAYSGIADCYTYLGTHYCAPVKASLRKAKEAALKALALDDALAEAHASLGFLLMHEWEWTRSEEEHKRAIELNPNNGKAHLFYGTYLRTQGRFDEALAEFEIAQQIDPLSLAIASAAAGALYLARRYDQAVEELLRIVELDPDFPTSHFYLGLIYEAQGRYDEAIAEYRRMTVFENDPEILAYIAHAYAVSGRRSEALGLLGKLTRLMKSGDAFLDSYFLALIYIGLGERDQAFTWLEKGCAEQDENLGLLKADPMLDPLRDDPRFSDLLRRVGLIASKESSSPLRLSVNA